MSDRDSLRDSSDPAQDPASLGARSKEGLGNRPAQNARQAASPSSANQSAPQEGAGDFLGLGFELEAQGISSGSSGASNSGSSASAGASDHALPGWMAQAETAVAAPGQSWLLEAGESGPSAEPAPEDDSVPVAAAPLTTSFQDGKRRGFASVWSVRILLAAAAASLLFVTYHVFRSSKAPNDTHVASSKPSAGSAATKHAPEAASTSTPGPKKPDRSKPSNPKPGSTDPGAASTAGTAPKIEPSAGDPAASASGAAGAGADSTRTAEAALPSWWPVPAPSEDSPATVASSAAGAPEPSTADAHTGDAAHDAASPGDASHGAETPADPDPVARASSARLEAYREGQGGPAASPVASAVPWTGSPARASRDTAAADLAPILPVLDDPWLEERLAQAASARGEAGAGVDKGLSLPRQIELAELTGMWLERTIPLDHVADATLLLTPAVGLVRVVLVNEETFEGRLHAVGENRVWLDTKLGRVGLADTRVARIESANKVSGKPDAEALKSLMPVVRVQTASGIVYGKLAARTEQDVTLFLEDGRESRVVPTAMQAAPRNLAVIGITKAVVMAGSSALKPGAKPAAKSATKPATKPATKAPSTSKAKK